MSDAAQTKQNISNNSERTQVKSQKERALPANSKGERMAEGLQARADHLWTAKETNKEQTSQKQVPPGLACATANQKATAVLLDQDSQGESTPTIPHGIRMFHVQRSSRAGSGCGSLDSPKKKVSDIAIWIQYGLRIYFVVSICGMWYRLIYFSIIAVGIDFTAHEPSQFVGGYCWVAVSERKE